MDRVPMISPPLRHRCQQVSPKRWLQLDTVSHQCSEESLQVPNMSSEKVVAIVMDDKTYEVDKHKLIENSDYFRALYGSGMRESTADSVQLQGLSGQGLELVLGFINTSKVHIVDETLEDLIETASFLQVTPILKLLPSEIRPENCVDLYRLSEVYGTNDLRHACLQFMTCHYHPMLRRPEFHLLSPELRDQVREMRMTGTATLLVIGDFTRVAAPSDGAAAGRLHQDGAAPWSMLRYGDAERWWKPLFSHNLPSDMRNVRGYGYTVLHNYLFIVGGYRVASQEMSAAHCYNPCRNEWAQIAPLNQKRQEPGRAPLLPVVRRLERAALLPHATRPQAADAVGGGHPVPGGGVHPRPLGRGAGRGPAPRPQPVGEHAEGAVVRRGHGRVAAAEGERLPLRTQPDVRAPQRRRLHHEPRRGRPPAQVQPVLRRLGGGGLLPRAGPQHAALLPVPAPLAVTGGRGAGPWVAGGQGPGW
ncbi:kelch-like protein 42 isoform X2 [Gadus macrocephalus]|uniref:kelch-like protein 42 isoform X2 n=1 Tax=Gadus macrocephalus TaxID=80720 RepID=UPI0028CB7CD7|nr:kelch-like protein 42 isoform X2 [Gadus macrocephalus]